MGVKHMLLIVLSLGSIVIRHTNSPWQPTAKIYRCSNSILLVDLLMIMFHRAYTK